MASSLAQPRAQTTSGSIEALRKVLVDTQAAVYASADEGYAKSIQRWSRAAEKPAGVAVEPTTTAEVASTVKFAADHGLDLAVTGGGHSTAGASSTDGGVLINLRRMRQVTVDVEARRLHVQGGALWGDVDEEAWKHGLATVGGTVADTGVGGLTLGGGYGALSGQYGLVIDNMISATVVTADGQIVRTSKEENEDLWWALLGAGQNFGVTTEFVLQAYPQKEAYVGTLLFPAVPEMVEKVVTVVNEMNRLDDAAQAPKSRHRGRANTLLALAKPPPAEGHTMLLLVLFYDGTEQEGQAMFKPLLDLGPVVNTMAMTPYPLVNKLLPAIIGMRSSMKGAAFFLPIRPAFVQDLITRYDAFIASCPDAAASLLAFELYDPSTVAALSAGSFANRGENLNGLVMPLWSEPENDQQCRQWAREMSLCFKDELERRGAETGVGVEGAASVKGKHGSVMLYGNYDQYDEKSRDIFGSNYPRLQRIKAKYDPGNLFNKLFPITPEAA